MGKLHTFQQMLDELKAQVGNLSQNGYIYPPLPTDDHILTSSSATLIVAMMSLVVAK
jgi:hypothetical protein